MWSVTWERSSESTPIDFIALVGANNPSAVDLDAPADGAVRYYRAKISAAGVGDFYSESVPGHRMGPPGVPSGLEASRDRAGVINLVWSAVVGADGYHVYRNGLRLTPGSGVRETTWNDWNAPQPRDSWGPPLQVQASTETSENITISWMHPTQPVGDAMTYRVSALSDAGESELSAAATGTTAATLPSGYLIEVQDSGGFRWHTTDSASENRWIDLNAPESALSIELAATDGVHSEFVRLSVGVTVDESESLSSYRVRAVFPDGTSGPFSDVAFGQRKVGELTVSWQRAPSRDGPFETIPLVGTGTLDDTTAPFNGEAVWYRGSSSAPGARHATSGVVLGRRLQFIDVGGGGSSTCAVAVGGRVWCWGLDFRGLLGVTGAYDATRNEPVTIPTCHRAG
jgi:hypothetical protein